MANKPIKEYEDFSGAAGYLIVDSLTNETSGGKMKVPNYVGVTDGYVLTKTSNDNTDEVVWAQAGGSGITNAGSPLIIPAGYNDKIELQYDSDTLELNGSNELTVKDPIPNTSSANDGDVLTYSSDSIVWAAPQGGGGGNPYTKVSVTPGSPYKNPDGRSSWGFDYSDQDVNINNNTYSILSTRIGEGNGTDVNETACIDHFNIKLPAGTDFPMAVVEFRVSTTYGAGVNKVKVFVGNTEIPELHEAPYSERVLVADDDTSGDLSFNELKDAADAIPAYKYLKGIHEENYKKYLPAYLDDNLVQVHIFGSGFKVVVSKPTGKPADS